MLDPQRVPMQASAGLLQTMQQDVTQEVERSSGIDSKQELNVSGDAVASHQILVDEKSSATVTMPDVLPYLDIPWPEPIQLILNSAANSALYGLFPSLHQAWIAVDNKLILWNYVTGTDIANYSNSLDSILSLSMPVRPRAGVFQPHISRVIAVATRRTVYLLGLCLIDSQSSTSSEKEIRIVDLGFSTGAPTSVVKFAVSERSGRIFGAGVDGQLYELAYSKENTVLRPRIHLVNMSVYFGKVPLLCAVGEAINFFSQTWVAPLPCLIDIALHDQGDTLLIYTLSEGSLITLWRVTEGESKLVNTMKHDTRNFSSHTTVHPSPLVSIFAHQTGVVAVSQNGDQFRYRYDCFKAFLSASDGERIESRCSGNDVCVAWCSGNGMIFSHAPRTATAGASSETLTFATSPQKILPPHSSCRWVVTHFGPGTTPIERCDAIGEHEDEGPPPNVKEMCAQVFAGPKKFAVVHRKGVCLFVKLRSVDILHGILTAPEKIRDALLQRFEKTFSRVDYCCMLVQIACGETSMGTAFDNKTRSSPAAMRSDIQALAHKLFSPPTSAVQKIARDLIRPYSLPTSMKEVTSVGTQRMLSLQMSPAVTALMKFFARSVYSLWSRPLFDLPLTDVRTGQQLLRGLGRFLEQLKKEVWSDQAFQTAYAVQWERSSQTESPSVVIPLSPTHQNDGRMLQSVYVKELFDLVNNALQVLQFYEILHAGGIVTDKDPERSDLRSLLGEPEKAHALARSISHRVLELAKNTTKGAELERVFAQAEQKCPYLFNHVYVAEYYARLQLDRMTKPAVRSLHLAHDATLQWEVEVANNAAVHWASGALRQMCEQLCSSGRDDVAVTLYLRAASQLDPSRTLAERYYLNRREFGEYNDVTYQEKAKIILCVQGVLEQGYLRNPRVIEELIGSPEVSGRIWSIEPTDELAHVLLFDWFCGPRNDEEVSNRLKQTIVFSGSRFVERYLRHHIQGLGSYCAMYLRKIQRNFGEAIRVCSKVAQSSLADVPEDLRLKYRLQCWQEALECAREGRLPEQVDVQRSVRIVEAQLLLRDVASSFLNSGESFLNSFVTYNDEQMTQGELADRTLKRLSRECVSHTELFEIGGWFPTFGGGEVQLMLLQSINVVDPSTYASTLERVFQRQNMLPENIARNVLAKFYDPIAFPLAFLIRILEARIFKEKPSGSSKAPDVLQQSVEHSAIFLAYIDVIEHGSRAGMACRDFDDARVTKEYLLYSLAYVTRHWSQYHAQVKQNKSLHDMSATGGPNSRSILEQALQQTRSLVERAKSGVNRSRDPASAQALADAEQVLIAAEKCYTSTDRLNRSSTSFVYR